MSIHISYSMQQEFIIDPFANKEFYVHFALVQAKGPSLPTNDFLCAGPFGRSGNVDRMSITTMDAIDAAKFKLSTDRQNIITHRTFKINSQLNNPNGGLKCLSKQFFLPIKKTISFNSETAAHPFYMITCVTPAALGSDVENASLYDIRTTFDLTMVYDD